MLFFWLFPGIEKHVVLGKASVVTAFVFFQKQPASPAAERQNEVTLPVGLTSVAFMLRSMGKAQDNLLDRQWEGRQPMNQASWIHHGHWRDAFLS